MKRKLHKHVVTKDKVTFRTAGTDNVRMIRMTKQEWLDKDQPETLEVSL